MTYLEDAPAFVSDDQAFASKRTGLTISSPVPAETSLPDGWKTCFSCKGSGIKTGLWACWHPKYGTRECDMCDGQKILPAAEVIAWEKRQQQIAVVA